jgi:hypothetical protein
MACLEHSKGVLSKVPDGLFSFDQAHLQKRPNGIFQRGSMILSLSFKVEYLKEAPVGKIF